MKEKTAVMLIIEQSGWNINSVYCQKMLELEKKQVMDAYERGVNVAGFALQGDVFIAKEQYFTDTYEQPK